MSDGQLPECQDVALLCPGVAHPRTRLSTLDGGLVMRLIYVVMYAKIAK
jgi:hypothetical protein